MRRRLLLGAGFVVVLSGLSLMVVHTGLVRRFVLVQIQTRLGNTIGLVIGARQLNYNLLAGRFELQDISVSAAQSSGMPAPLRAQRVMVSLPLWRLLGGSFDTARIQIDGLAVDWITAAGGQSNWPVIESTGGGKPGGPTVLVTGGNIAIRNDRDGYGLQLPIDKVSAAWNPVKSAYGISCDSGGGQFQWNA